MSLEKAASLFYDCIKHEKCIDVFLPDDAVCYYSNNIIHMHREMWSEENLIIFHSDSDYGEDMVRAENPYRTVYVSYIDKSYDCDQEYINMLAGFMQLENTDHFTNYVNTHCAYYKCNYSEIYRISKLMAFL